MSAPRILLAGLCLALSACAAKKPPPPQRYSLGGTQVEYRDYALVRGSLCDADPRLLGQELKKVNELLEQFVANTEPATKPEATAEQVELLREGSTGLKPVVEAHTKNIAGLRACDFSRKPPFPDLVKQGEAALTSAKARLDEAPDVLAAADKRIAEEKWQTESVTRETNAKQEFCKANTAVGSGDLYFAREELEGKKRWLFCDGLVVEAPSGGAPTLVIPDSVSKRDRRRIQASKYLEAAKNYPSEEIDRLGATKEAAAE